MMRQGCRYSPALQRCDRDMSERCFGVGVDEDRQRCCSELYSQLRGKLVATDHGYGFARECLGGDATNRIVAAQRVAVTDDQRARRSPPSRGVGGAYSAAAFNPLPAASSACDRSPMMSSMCSMPTDSLM